VLGNNTQHKSIIKFSESQNFVNVIKAHLHISTILH